MPTTEIALRWTPLYNNHKEAMNIRYANANFYAFSSRNRNLLYIGISRNQDLWCEMDYSAGRLHRRIHGYFINHNYADYWWWVGEIMRNRSTIRRITNRLLFDVESLLIFSNQPLMNTQHIARYNGRRCLVVRSENFSLIRNYNRDPNCR